MNFKSTNNLHFLLTNLTFVLFLLLTSLMILLICIKLSFPFDIILLYIFAFFMSPVEDLTSAPIKRYLGYYNYYSKMLIGIKKKKRNLLILHDATLLDYVYLYFNFRKQKKRITTKILLACYLKGLLKIINQIEKNIISDNTVIIGSSYFFNEHNSNQFGFKIFRPKKYTYFKFVTNYLNILLKRFFVKHKLSFPNIFKFKTIIITANELKMRKQVLKKLIYRIQNNNSISE